MSTFTGTIPTFSSGEDLTATDLTTVTNQLHAIADSWTSYTPVWGNTGTANSLGNGTLTGSYKQSGKDVDFTIRLTIGSTTTFGSATFTFTVPVAMVDRFTCMASLFDSSAITNRTAGAVDMVNSTTIDIYAAPGGNVTATVPFTWATSDRIVISGKYEAA